MLFNGNNKHILSWVELSWVDEVLSVDKRNKIHGIFIAPWPSRLSSLWQNNEISSENIWTFP